MLHYRTKRSGGPASKKKRQQDKVILQSTLGLYKKRKVTVLTASSSKTIPRTGTLAEKLSTVSWSKKKPAEILQADDVIKLKGGTRERLCMPIHHTPIISCTAVGRVCEVDDWVNRLNIIGMTKMTIWKPRKDCTLLDNPTITGRIFKR